MQQLRFVAVQLQGLDALLLRRGHRLGEAGQALNVHQAAGEVRHGRGGKPLRMDQKAGKTRGFSMETARKLEKTTDF